MDLQGCGSTHISTSCTIRPSTPPRSLEASAVLENQDVISVSFRSLKENYNSRHIKHSQNPSKHDKLLLTSSEEDFAHQENQRSPSSSMGSEFHTANRSEPPALASPQSNIQITWCRPIPTKMDISSIPSVSFKSSQVAHGNVIGEVGLEALEEALCTLIVEPLRCDENSWHFVPSAENLHRS